MIDCLFRKLDRRSSLDEVERAALTEAMTRVIEFRPRQTIVQPQVVQNASNLLLSGIVCRYKDLPDGHRQILELHVPGDFVDLHSFVLKKLEHTVAAITPATIGYVPHESLRRITETLPRLGRILWLSTMLDASIHREWILSIGRRSAIGRIAHLICELDARLDLVGLTAENRFRLPITQIDISDATGLTPVHVNRVLRDLREQGAMSFRGGEVHILDRPLLLSIAEFDPGYLYLERVPE